MATARQTVPDSRGVAQTVIAAFDCDGTLIRGDATRRFLLLLRGPLGLAFDLSTLTPKLLAWRLGRCSTGRLKEAVLDRALQAAPHWRREAALRELHPILIAMLRPEAVARLRWHQQHGHRCLIVTASPEPLIAPLARHLGVELIATGCSDLLEVGGCTPFLLTTPNCKGPEKLRRLELYLGYHPQPQDLESYGDSRGDRTLLQASRHPHWRSFRHDPVTYPINNNLQRVLPLLAMCLVLSCLYGIRSATQDVPVNFTSNAMRLLQWLPALYGLLALSYLGRYARWRVLLGSVGVGRWGLADAQGWFRGFALTASPGKLGELTRVADLHQQLHYPRLALLHTFVVERACDVIAVAIWLLLLLPQHLAHGVQRYGVWLGILLAALLWLFVFSRARWVSVFIHRHLPCRAMLRACFPALFLSCLFWGCEALILWVLVGALSAKVISPLVAIAVYLLSGTAGMLSTLPGGIGVNEAATVVLLVQQGIPASIALPIALIRRLITPWSVVALAAGVGLLPLPSQRSSGPSLSS